MSNLTPLQQLAVDKKNKNIIVSAGAGSGKTTVLKSRVLRILESGVNINNLIILTFTNNAAAEMKERIRNIINETPELEEQAELLDSAYITTFDSFAQSLVKKYNYLLNISKDFSIVDASIISLEIEHSIDDIFEELYANEDEKFLKLVSDFEIKNDNKIKQTVKNYYASLSNVLNKQDFLDNYISVRFSEPYINDKFEEFEDNLFCIKDDLVSMLENLKDETIKDKAIETNNNFYEALISATTFDELFIIKSAKLADNRGDAYTEYGALLKEECNKLKKTIVAYLSEDKNTLIDHYKSTKVYIEAIIEILKRIDDRITSFKAKHNVYEFSDIALKAIELVKNFDDVRNDIKNNTYEIMIDEYQDTNDIQEEFISYIENNNVYMVGDVKQSIYRFRNANPYIFKKKYDEYSKDINGFKIDLNMNFRSRCEVIDNINLIFDNIMFDDVGGADYKSQHEMISGNVAYKDHNHNDSYDLEILEYNIEDKQYNYTEAEAFIIADDIISRMERQEKVTYIENDTMKYRDIAYKDFCILVDKSKNFELLKKVLEFKNIPATIYKDIKLNDEDEIYILKNLINLIIKVKENTFDISFKHSFLSIARSFVYKISDDEIYKIFVNNSFDNTDLYKLALELSSLTDSLSNKDLLYAIIDKFDVISKLNIVGDVNERLTKLEYFLNSVANLNDFGMTIYDLNDYFDSMLSSDEDIKMTTNKNSGANSVTIMTIHGSKGLEYPYVYLPYLNSDFTKDPNNSKFKFSNDLGFITPFYKDGVGNTFMLDLYKTKEKVEELSERIRLFYVALTRAKEKIIMINSFNEKILPLTNITSSSMINAKSFTEILSLIKYKISKYINSVDLDSLNITTDYNLVKLNNYSTNINKSNKKITVTNLNIDNQVLENKHFSKPLSKVIDRKLKERLDFGTLMHYVFEVYDFNNDNLKDLDIDDSYKEKIRNFLNHDEVKNIKNAKVYKEHEIRFKDNDSVYHGFIDLLLEYEDHFDIIDYKLSNLESDEYKKQLTGYKNYIETKYNKSCYIYLYSINKDIFKNLN
ncbi:MAG: UvrD-helicase domain-containing protein [Erysipelotrichales bacterium]|nr:UvrD-helicase domain-containing protein [Erysipelotrichales bacterium]